ncbi:unnamed protein product [Sphagnum jensenii]|uniref:Uncharacterized protein n=1 Tax=Sphagnum jensenii TaxID=128206 RepID=A0ABP0W4M4_9BRYO
MTSVENGSPQHAERIEHAAAPALDFLHKLEAHTEELKKSTRSNKWFKLGCKSTAVSPTPCAAFSGNEAKEDMSTTRHSTAPKIRRSRAPLVVNYFPTGVTLSLR